MSRQKTIEIPQTKDYGWDLDEETGERVFKPTTKAIWNRIKYIAEQRGARIEPRTMGFRVIDVEKLSKQDRDMMEEEAARLQIYPEGDVKIGENGREEPNFDND